MSVPREIFVSHFASPYQKLARIWPCAVCFENDHLKTKGSGWARAGYLWSRSWVWFWRSCYLRPLSWQESADNSVSQKPVSSCQEVEKGDKHDKGTDRNGDRIP